jgi:AcrR family transcriptional regulator
MALARQYCLGAAADACWPMGSDLNIDKTIHPAKHRYHHGALREALIKAAEDLIEERGLAGFSLREAARRAGVSSAAPAHHFGDARGLLTAVAAAAFERFGLALERAGSSADLRERLKAQAIAYLRFALAERARFLLMWRVDLIDRASPEYSAAIRRATGVLTQARREPVPLVGEEDPFRDVETRVARLKDSALDPAVAVWALVHGFATLALNGVFGAVDDPDGGPEARLRAIIDRIEL